ncbi:MAG TPA: DUF4118 domain-containing protein [Candidatus Angelobacter sp.]
MPSAALQLSIFPTATLPSVILETVGTGHFLRSTELFVDEHNRRLRQVLDATIGALLCTAAAWAVSAISQGRPWEAWAPLLFVIVLLAVAGVFGALAGILGTILAAIIFAAFLFPPLGSIHVGDSAARTNLAWMSLAGISYAFLFAPSNSMFRRH